MEETLAQLDAGIERKNFHIVERINIDFILEVSILPKAPNLTKFRMTGHLPLLQASISDKKYKAMMKLIDVVIPKLDEPAEKAVAAKGPAKSLEPPTYQELRRASAFQFSNQEREILLAEELDEDGSVIDEDEFQEASEGSTDNVGVQQKTFELRFTVDKLVGSLSKADVNGKSEKELVTLVAEHFSLNVVIRPFDLTAEVMLKSLNVDDLIDEDPSPDFKKIVTSDGLSANADTPLFLVKYVQVKKESPEFMSKYEAIDKHIDVSISKIDVVVTRKTVLTLLDFVITTFTNPDQAPQQTSPEGADSDQVDLVRAPDPEKIRVKIDLDSISFILNNDGIRLATLSLASATLGVFLMGKTMRIGGRLGNFSLIDDINEGAGESSPFRQLVSIQGEELAEFRYETFDPEVKSSYPGYNSSIFLRSGSVKVNFVEEPFRKIIDFAVKFGKMQALFNAARQAAMNQANQIQEHADKMRFDILVRTPIIVFPRVTNSNAVNRDLITAYLGEIYAQNRFTPLDDKKDSVTVNNIEAGIRKTRLTSEFHYEHDQSEELELLDKLDLTFGITYVEHVEGLKRPDVEVCALEEFHLGPNANNTRFKEACPI